MVAGAPINIRDGIGQTALTIALHYNHDLSSMFLIENGSYVLEDFFEHTISPLAIAQLKKNNLVIELIEKRISEKKRVIEHVSSYFSHACAEDMEVETPANPTNCDSSQNFSRAINISVGDQKNTVTVNRCANACPDIYGCHTPGAGDFHNRGYINETVLRIAGQVGFWQVVEKVMKRPTVNPQSFKQTFKDNNYNNNEALYHYEDDISIAMDKRISKLRILSK